MEETAGKERLAEGRGDAGEDLSIRRHHCWHVQMTPPAVFFLLLLLLLLLLLVSLWRDGEADGSARAVCPLWDRPIQQHLQGKAP